MRRLPALILLLAAPALAAPAPTVIDAHRFAATGATVMRDARAPGGKAAVCLFARSDSAAHEFLHGTTPDLSPGDYRVTAWLEFVPLATQNLAAARLTVGTATRRATAAHFDVGGYTPITLRIVHPGGPVAFSVEGSAGNRVNGMRAGQSADEKLDAVAKPEATEITGRKPDDLDKLDLDEARDVASLKFNDVRLACSRIEFAPIRLSDALVTGVDVDKVHYVPGETVKATCTVRGDGGTGLKLVAELVNEVDHATTVFERDVESAVGSPQTIAFDFKLDATTEFGHALRCSLKRGGNVLHSNDQVFGVSRNVYRVGITGSAGPQDRSRLTVADAEKIARENKAAYANYFECFAWAPCDFCEMTPDRESFFSGQTQYHGSVSGFKNLIAGAHKYGVKAITYGKSTACGIDGAAMYLRHPQWFGGGSPDFDSFYLERAFYDEHIMDLGAPGSGQVVKWQHWANWWVNDADRDAVNFGCDELARSARMFGWDGVRWDGHYVGGMAYFNDRLQKQVPGFINGYNIAFANPGSATFMPSLPVADFHETAKGHGLMMDESVRDWSGVGAGGVRPYYEAICREADYEKRIGGLPLFIQFDTATAQDAIHNVLWGLAAGQRYTYGNTVGDFNAGPLTRFLTRYSAFVWDDTARVAEPSKVVTVSAPSGAVGRGPQAGRLNEGKGAPAGPWFDQSTWLRKLPDGRQQLLVNLVNPPGYAVFCNRVQTPPTPLRNLSVKANLPAGAKLLRAFSVSVDNPDGLSVLDATADAGQATVTLPELRFWAIVAFEFAGAADPAYPLTTPVEDAAKVLADQERQKALAAEQAAKKAASGVNNKPAKSNTPWYDDYAHPRNVDLEHEKKIVRPVNIAPLRNGLLDVVHAKGMYGWLNPVENAIGLAGGGNLRDAYANHAGWRVGPEGCMENFPDTYRELLAQDVVILDNTLATDLGNRHRVMLADFVRSGGGLIVLGGCNALSCGTDHNSYVGDMLPVTITGRRNTVTDNKGWAFAAAPENDVFGPAVDWSRMQAFTVDASPLKEGAKVVAKIGDRPAIVTRPYGKGRVLCVLTNFEGDYADGAKPYWLSAQYPALLADAIKWAAGDYRAVTKPQPVKRVADPTKAVPVELLLNSDGMAAAEFSKKLIEARDNVEDAAAAATLIQAAADNPSKLADNDMLLDLVNELESYVDDSFAPLAEKITNLRLDNYRVAGFVLLRKCKSPSSRDVLEAALAETNPMIVREALAALAHAKDPASIPAIRLYLAKGGKERLLGMAALRMMGDPAADLGAALAQYVDGSRRAVALMAFRKSVFERLYGGTSFKLTLADRKNLERQYARARAAEKDAIFDVTQFRSTLARFDDAQAAQFATFVAAADNRAAASMAFAALPHFNPPQRAAFNRAMAAAKLPQLRALAIDGN